MRQKKAILEVIKRHSSFIELADGRWLLQTTATITDKKLVEAMRKFLTKE